MKRLIKVFIVVLIGLFIIPVNAANYNMKELIPMSIKTTIHSNNFSYKGIYFDNEAIYFTNIKNLTDKELPLSFSIGLFNANKENIGTINFCDSNLSIASKSEMPFMMQFNTNYMDDNYSVSDIKYIALMGDNITCKVGGQKDFVGQTVKEIGVPKNTTINDQTYFLIKIFAILGGALLVFFLYSFLFTKKFQNFDGNDVRGAYKRVNADLAKEREEELIKNPPVEKLYIPDKPIEILEEEEEAKNETGDDTDLHNLYK